MKVYCAFVGCYSDRRLVGVFSTKEKGKACLDAMRMFGGWSDPDDEPRVYEMDEANLDENTVWISVTEAGEIVSGDWYGWRDDDVSYDEMDHCYIVRVAFQPDRERMEKAVRDKIAAFKAREAGI